MADENDIIGSASEFLKGKIFKFEAIIHGINLIIDADFAFVLNKSRQGFNAFACSKAINFRL